MFEYKVRCRHKLGWKEFTFYATTDIEEFLNRNSIDYVRNATDTVENRLFKENKRLNNIINELEKSWKEEIIRFNNFIQEDTSLIEINNIRKMLIQAREKDLYKLQELKGSE